MLAMTDTPIEQFIPVFAETGVFVAFLVPTPTGFGKSIMDAIHPVRQLFMNSGLHDYSLQDQGPANKVIVPARFVYPDKIVESQASLYRPVTKQGDPRIWFYGLKNYCSPCNLLALFVSEGKIFVINLSRPDIQASLQGKGFVYEVLLGAARASQAPAKRLLAMIRKIHGRGFVRSLATGDTAVGDTLEHELGIKRNNSEDPDIFGIELKAKRVSRNGAKKTPTRSTLFTQVPDEGLTYRGIVERYGKEQIPRGKTEPRLQLYETFRVSRANAYDLQLEVDAEKDKLLINHVTGAKKEFVSAWTLQKLRERLLTKHRETFWVEAASEMREDGEWFRYDKIIHTQKPNTSLLAPLFENDTITLDLAAHIDPKTGAWRDHGALFKILGKDLPLLVGETKIYDLSQSGAESDDEPDGSNDDDPRDPK